MNYKFGGWVLFIDLDDLRKINNTLGHRKGDEILRKTGIALIKSSFYSAFRFGGDEFVILSFSRNKEFLERVVKDMEKIEVSFSYGIAKIEEEAEKKMYQMKNDKNRKR